MAMIFSNLHPRPKITEWLPLIVVFLAAGFTYFITLVIEDRRHKRELKRQVYFELIDAITKTRKVYEDSLLGPKPDEAKKDKDIEIAHAFVAAKVKAYIGGSKELNSLVDEQLQAAITSDNKTYQEFLKKLTGKMTAELVKPSIIKKLRSLLKERMAK